MINVEMLEELGRQSWVGSRRPGPQLKEIFDLVVRGGWAPRRPAFEPELARLEVSTARGDSVAPVLQDGDILYIDPHTPAQSGDLVSFALSARGAEVQNSALPPGQSPWCKCARWVKLLVDYRGHAMLLDRYGSAATTTLLGGESPDAHVPLFPVRNVRRTGRLLFTPDVYSAQLGFNAATDISTAFIASITVNDTASSGPAFDGIAVSTVFSALRFACTAIVTLTFQASRSSSISGNGWVYIDSLLAGHSVGELVAIPNDTTIRTYATQHEYSYNVGDAPIISVKSNGTGGGGTPGVIYQNVRMQVEFIKR